MRASIRECLIAAGYAVAVAVASAAAGSAVRAAESVTNPPPRPADWAALAKLPDWSGVWTPSMSDQNERIKTDPIPWTAPAAAQIKKLVAAEEAGDPNGRFVNCLPESM